MLIVTAGTLGYTLLEGWTPVDAFYMTIITISTVGYGETHELSGPGRVFTIGFLTLCLFAMSFWTASLTSYLVDGDLKGRLLAKRMLKMISRLKDHTIVCGIGRMGSILARFATRVRVACFSY